MHETITAADANRNFSSILRRVREGETFVVTSHGRAVAEIVPAGAKDRAKEVARDALIERLRNQPTMNIGPWTRDELYDDEP